MNDGSADGSYVGLDSGFQLNILVWAGSHCPSRPEWTSSWLSWRGCMGCMGSRGCMGCMGSQGSLGSLGGSVVSLGGLVVSLGGGSVVFVSSDGFVGMVGFFLFSSNIRLVRRTSASASPFTVPSSSPVSVESVSAGFLWTSFATAVWPPVAGIVADWPL